jgi:RND superfamily putative drug exporter
VALFLAAAGLAALLAPDRLSVGGFTDQGSESARALAGMQDALGYDPEPGMIVVARSPAGFGAKPRRAQVQALARRIAADPAVGTVETAFGGRALPLLIAGDGRRTLLLVHFRSADPDALAAPIRRLRRAIRAPGLELAVGGFAVGYQDVSGAAREDLDRSRLIAFPVIALLLLLLFRGFAAAGVPLLIGGAAVLGTVACLRLLSGALDLSVFALNQTVGLGLGLSVDYGLLLVSRYREEAAARGPGPAAVRATMATAGRTVAFAGCAVAGACAGLLAFPVGLLASIGLAGVVVSLLAAAAALVITPPLLLLAGPRIGAAAPRATTAAGAGRWARLTRWVTSSHRDVALAGTAVLIAAAAPALLLKATFAEYDATPRGYESRAVSETILRDFSPYLGRPISVLAGVGPGEPRADAVVGTLGRIGGVASLRTLPERAPDALVVQLLPARPSLSPEIQAAVRRIRALPAPLLVGGRTAEFVDLKAAIGRRAPLALLIAALSAFAVLFAMTGSVVLPLKGLAFTLLTIGAAFGLVVLIFQERALGIAGLLGYDGPSAIEITTCAVMVALTFGLASDYAVLMLARIEEAHADGAPDAEAVALGMQRSGPVVTGAALVMCAALLALVSSRIFFVKQLAIGQTLAVAIDATLVRVLLVPAFMRLLGPANWWAPAPLRRLRSRLTGFGAAE